MKRIQSIVAIDTFNVTTETVLARISPGDTIMISIDAGPHSAYVHISDVLYVSPAKAQNLIDRRLCKIIEDNCAVILVEVNLTKHDLEIINADAKSLDATTEEYIQDHVNQIETKGGPVAPYPVLQSVNVKIVSN